MHAIFDFDGGDLASEVANISQPLPRGSVYVIGFSSSTVKVGRTRNPIERMTAHAAEATRHGLTITRAWVSEPHENFAANEKALKDWCVEFGTPLHGTEYFTAVAADEVIEFAEMLGSARGDERFPARFSPVIPRCRSLEEASTESGLPLKWLKDSCRARRIPHIRAGRSWLVTPGQIAQALLVAKQAAA